MVEQGCLLSSYTGKTGVGGSNPPLSATHNQSFGRSENVSGSLSVSIGDRDSDPAPDADSEDDDRQVWPFPVCGRQGRASGMDL